MKISTIFITHDIEEAVKISDRIYIMGKNPGTIIDEIEIKEDFQENFFEDKKFIEYKKYIIEKLDKLIWNEALTSFF